MNTLYDGCSGAELSLGVIQSNAKKFGWRRMTLAEIDSSTTLRGKDVRPSGVWQFEVAPSEPAGTKMQFDMIYVVTSTAQTCKLRFSGTWASSLVQSAVSIFGKVPNVYRKDGGANELLKGQMRRSVWNMRDESNKVMTFELAGPVLQDFNRIVIREVSVSQKP